MLIINYINPIVTMATHSKHWHDWGWKLSIKGYMARFEERYFCPKWDGSPMLFTSDTVAIENHQRPISWVTKSWVTTIHSSFNFLHALTYTRDMVKKPNLATPLLLWWIRRLWWRHFDRLPSESFWELRNASRVYSHIIVLNGLDSPRYHTRA